MEVLLFVQILKMVVLDRKIMIFILTVSKGPILSVSPIENLSFIVKDHIEMSPCSYANNILFLESFDLCRFGDFGEGVFTMAERACRIPEDPHYCICLFATISERIYFSFL